MEIVVKVGSKAGTQGGYLLAFLTVADVFIVQLRRNTAYRLSHCNAARFHAAVASRKSV